MEDWCCIVFDLEQQSITFFSPLMPYNSSIESIPGLAEGLSRIVDTFTFCAKAFNQSRQLNCASWPITNNYMTSQGTEWYTS